MYAGGGLRLTLAAALPLRPPLRTGGAAAAVQPYPAAMQPCFAAIPGSAMRSSPAVLLRPRPQSARRDVQWCRFGKRSSSTGVRSLTHA